MTEAIKALQTESEPARNYYKIRARKKIQLDDEDDTVLSLYSLHITTKLDNPYICRTT